MSGFSHTSEGNTRRRRIILALAAASAAVYLLLATAGDLRGQLPLFWTAHALLALGMIAAWRVARRTGGRTGLLLGAALVFRLLAAAGDPALSDDVHRYVWDGRVQLNGFHPYALAPEAPQLSHLRDEEWAKINHPELRTIYPPGAQAVFLGLAATGAGQRGFRLALGLADFAVVLALALFLRRAGLPRDRVVLYAWNPLAVMETAGSGHVEPLGAALVLLAVVASVARWRACAGAVLAAGGLVKLLPLLLVPGQLSRDRWRWLAGFAVTTAALVAPYALTGPAVGSGLFDYAERWSRNSVVYPVVLSVAEGLETGERLKPAVAWLQQRAGELPVPWDQVYSHVWPPSVARGLLGVAALAWIGWCVARLREEPGRHAFAVIAGVLLLSPTLHPWYLLWVLPFAAAYLSPPWLLLALLVPLGYAGGDGGVPTPFLLAEYGPPVLLAAWLAWRRPARERKNG